MMGRFDRARNAFAAAFFLFCTIFEAEARSALPSITSVRINQNGARSNDVSGDETVAFCRRFRLSNDDVRQFFDRAERVDERAFRHDLDMSRCHARGELLFRDGRRASWFIDLERRGSLEFRSAQAPLFFVCPKCSSARYDSLDANR